MEEIEASGHGRRAGIYDAYHLSDVVRARG